MTDEELIEILKEFDKKRVEQLQEPARNLFYAIMRIADERDMLKEKINKAIEYCNNNIEFTQRLIDVIDILK